jgi:hypothetical protein
MSSAVRRKVPLHSLIAIDLCRSTPARFVPVSARALRAASGRFRAGGYRGRAWCWMTWFIRVSFSAGVASAGSASMACSATGAAVASRRLAPAVAGWYPPRHPARRSQPMPRERSLARADRSSTAGRGEPPQGARRAGTALVSRCRERTARVTGLSDRSLPSEPGNKTGLARALAGPASANRAPIDDGYAPAVSSTRGLPACSRPYRGPARAPRSAEKGRPTCLAPSPLEP